MIQDPKTARKVIAQRIALELHDGDIVNLGIGIPTLVANFIPKGIQVHFQSENGILGMGPAPAPGMEHPQLNNAGGMPITFLPGAVAFDSATSFGLIRGRHVDITVLGGLEVDQRGLLANWMVPGKMIPGMGGAMDLVTGAKKVIVAMTHTNKDGSPKIIPECTLPLTSIRPIHLIVTEMAVIAVEPGIGLVLKEIAPQTSLEEVLKATTAQLKVSDSLTVMDVQLSSGQE